MNTENLSTLKIHLLTQSQYDRELVAGNINDNEMYLTPEEEIDLSGYSQVGHTHSEYAAKGHTHTNYAAKEHTHMASDINTSVSGGTYDSVEECLEDLKTNKSNVGHTHAASSITFGTTTLDEKLTTMQSATSALQNSVFSLTNFKADTEHEHYTSDIIYSDATLGDIALGTKLSNIDSTISNLSGVTSGLVTSVDNKADKTHTHAAEDVSVQIQGNTGYKTVQSYLNEFVDPEIKDLFDNKANVDHTHSYSAEDITHDDTTVGQKLDDLSNSITQTQTNFGTALGYKANVDHNHDGVYTYGMRRTMNEGYLSELGTDCTSFTTDDNTEKIYSLLIGSTSDPTVEEQVCTTVFFDWQMIEHGSTIKLYYTFEDPSSSAGVGYVKVTKNSDGRVSFELTNTSHRIRHVCGYV